jgi:signal transduction histidine kinase
MPKKTIKLLGVLLTLLAAVGVLFFLQFKIELLVYVILLFSLLLLLLLLFLSYEIEKLQKINFGIIKVLENSEKKVVSHSFAQNSILSVINKLEDGIILLNSDNCILFINQIAENLLSISSKKVLKERLINIVFPVDKQEIARLIILNLKSKNVQEIKTNSGNFLEITTDILNNDKKDQLKIVVIRNITKIKQAQDIKEKFVSMVGHQIKTPLSSIRMSVKMLIDQNFGKITLQQKNILNKIYKASESLISLSDNMLESAKNGNYHNLSNKPINLEKITDSVLQLYEDSIKEKKLKVNFKRPLQDFSVVYADPERIKIVIQNLIENAIKYNLSSGKIGIEINGDNREMRFKISDSGIGIPENQKQKIFSRFSRIKNNKTAGHGLGLAISKDIIEGYNGKMWFDSVDKKGSSFYFSLPFVKQ